MAPKNFKLIYFDARGRGEVLRLLLTAAGVEFEDVRMAKEEWANEKSKCPFGQVPCLEVDGQRYGQTIAIANYVAREFGLYGKNSQDQLVIDQVVQLTQDFIMVVMKTFYEVDENRRVELLKKLKEEEVPKYLSYYETLLQEKGNKGHFVGSSLSLADIVVFDIVDTMKVKDFGTDDACPGLQKLIKNVESHDKIKAYLAARKADS